MRTDLLIGERGVGEKKVRGEEDDGAWGVLQVLIPFPLDLVHFNSHILELKSAETPVGLEFRVLDHPRQFL